jgi:TetR/AcrR family transcriptional repressor of nem operon
LKSSIERAERSQISVRVAGDTPEDKRSSAIAAWSALVGAMVLARLVNEDELSKEILAKTRAALPLR